MEPEDNELLPTARITSGVEPLNFDVVNAQANTNPLLTKCRNQ